MNPVVIARSRRPSPVLACKKCLKRCARGKQIKQGLKSELKRRFKEAGKPPRLVLTSCFGICPKNAVTVASGTTLESGQFVLVSKPGGIEDAINRVTRRQPL